MAETISIFPTVYLALILSSNLVDGFGVNCGVAMSHSIDSDSIATLITSNGFTSVKLYEPNPAVMGALASASIDITIGIPNEIVPRLTLRDNAEAWVFKNVIERMVLSPNGTSNIRYVAVGNEPLLRNYDINTLQTTFQALQNIQQSLDDLAKGFNIKAVIPLNADVFSASSNKPSSGNFRSDLSSVITKVISFLNSRNAPFFVNIQPFLTLSRNPNFTADYAFFNARRILVNDDGRLYKNIFDATYDTVVWFLRKQGFPKVTVMVGEIGWPTDGEENANIQNARRFYRGFLRKITRNEGTPLNPGRPIKAFLSGLIDENLKSVAPGNFERHWGIFLYDGKTKFKVYSLGRGNKTNPLQASRQMMEYLPSQWCVFNREKKDVDMGAVAERFEYACRHGDCSSLGHGSSCNNLDFFDNVSYAFNMYYQMQEQEEEACNFQGLAILTVKNPSRGSCVFPVQILSLEEKKPKSNFSVGILVLFVLAGMPLLLMVLIMLL